MYSHLWSDDNFKNLLQFQSSGKFTCQITIGLEDESTLSTFNL